MASRSSSIEKDDRTPPNLTVAHACQRQAEGLNGPFPQFFLDRASFYFVPDIFSLSFFFVLTDRNGSIRAASAIRGVALHAMLHTTKGSRPRVFQEKNLTLEGLLLWGATFGSR